MEFVYVSKTVTALFEYLDLVAYPIWKISGGDFNTSAAAVDI